MDAACTIQDSIHVFSLVRKYVSRILGTYHVPGCRRGIIFLRRHGMAELKSMERDFRLNCAAANM